MYALILSISLLTKHEHSIRSNKLKNICNSLSFNCIFFIEDVLNLLILEETFWGVVWLLLLLINVAKWIVLLRFNKLMFPPNRLNDFIIKEFFEIISIWLAKNLSHHFVELNRIDTKIRKFLIIEWTMNQQEKDWFIGIIELFIKTKASILTSTIDFFVSGSKETFSVYSLGFSNPMKVLFVV